jgi:hypothetical protein
LSLASLARLALARIALVGLGAAFGLYFVFTSAYRDAPLWPVWAPLAVALTATAGAVFRYGLDRWIELAEVSKRHTLRVRDVAVPVAAIAAVTLLIALGSTRSPGPARTSWRGLVVLTITILGGLPGLSVMDGVRRAAGQPMPSTRGELVATLVALRQLLQRLLTAVGSLVALSTLATGAGVALQQSQLPGSSQGTAAELPPQFVLVFGGAGSLLVALFYVPAATALQHRGQELRDALFPLAKADEPSTILSLAEDRQKLEQLLGMDRGVVADLQTGLTILGPLLASAAAAFLSP